MKLEIINGLGMHSLALTIFECDDGSFLAFLTQKVMNPLKRLENICMTRV